jgi:outer membrane lipoprotein carrier protein
MARNTTPRVYVYSADAMRYLLPILTVVATATASAQQPPAAKDVVAKIQKYYDATKDLHARFEQTLESAIGRTTHASGDVYLKKPGKMRWDYAKPEKKEMVADGKCLWVYEEEDAQVFKQSMSASTLPTQVSFLVGAGKLADEFDATVEKPKGVGGPNDIVLKMVPKTASSAYRYLYFVVDPKTGAVLQTVIFDQQGGTNKLSFSNVEQNTNPPDAKFSFTPPAGVKVITPPGAGAQCR